MKAVRETISPQAMDFYGFFIWLPYFGMAPLNETLDAAIWTYLGGDWENGAIQIGLRDERLIQRFGANATQLKPQIEKILADALAFARDRTGSEAITTYSWVANSNPDLSHVACLKIESAIIFELEH
jgi:hypothetical protein